MKRHRGAAALDFARPDDHRVCAPDTLPVMAPTTALPTWERRFRAPTTSMPDWSRHAPDRLVYAGNESGVWQVHCLDAVSGKSRRVTDHPVGVTDGTPTLDGAGVLWFADETGAESGRWFVAPFTEGDARPFLQGVPDGPGPGARHRGRGGQRSRRLRRLRLAGWRTRPRARAQRRGPGHRRRVRGRLQSGGAVGRRIAALPRAQRTRRPHPPP